MTDSHSTIISENKLNELSRISDTIIIKLEYSPTKDVYDIDNYKLKVDEDIVPEKYYEFENSILKKVHQITLNQIKVKENNSIEPMFSGNYGRIVGGDILLIQVEDVLLIQVEMILLIQVEMVLLIQVEIILLIQVEMVLLIQVDMILLIQVEIILLIQVEMNLLI
jgi:hypothetical protein